MDSPSSSVRRAVRLAETASGNRASGVASESAADTRALPVPHLPHLERHRADVLLGRVEHPVRFPPRAPLLTLTLTLTLTLILILILLLILLLLFLLPLLLLLSARRVLRLQVHLALHQAAAETISGPNCWAQPDMLEVGNTKPPNGAPGSWKITCPALTRAESQIHFGLWCVTSAPLVSLIPADPSVCPAAELPCRSLDTMSRTQR